jgi:hypothetical protein
MSFTQETNHSLNAKLANTPPLIIHYDTPISKLDTQGNDLKVQLSDYFSPPRQPLFGTLILGRRSLEKTSHS